ncbi:hypothetical protein K502DRAFT_342630 [Neoconidiobolus thromboides FSU 785]|nr:hypothetical protein K502DRAFT_342630 [Neoconidiobolus thromboides FSU 785]
MLDLSDPIVIGTVVSDIIICLSYFAIPIEIWFFQRSLTRPLPFKYVLVFFEVFITACGITHLVAIWVPWTRTDPVLLASKVLCAIVSFATACVLIFVIPKVFSLPVKTALLQEELGFRIKHEQSLQVANDVLRKFRKITNQIRKKLDVEVICDVVVHELSVNLNFSGLAIFLPDEVNGDLICYSEYIQTHNQVKENSGIKAHYWKTINMDPNNDIVKKIICTTCTLHLNCNDMVELVNKQRGALFKSGLAMSFEMSENGGKGFILGFYEQESIILNEEDLEMFEDVLVQLEIALQQARQIQLESYHLKKIQNQMRNNHNLYQLKQDADINNQFKSKLITHLNKELNDPLKYIKQCLQAIAQHNNLNEEQTIQFNYINNYFNQLDGILLNLDESVKIESNQLTLINQTLNINQLVTGVFEQQSNYAKTKNIQLHLNVLPDTPQFIIGDQLRLKQAMSILLNNSIKYSTRDQDVSIFISLNEDPPAAFIPFLKDPRCCTFDSQYNPSFISNVENLVYPIETDPTLPKTYSRKVFYFHVVDFGIGMRNDQVSKIIRAINQIDCDTRTLSDNDDKLVTDLSNNIELGLGFWMLSYYIKLFHGNMAIRSCKGRGSVFTFSAKLFIPSVILE